LIIRLRVCIWIKIWKYLYLGENKISKDEFKLIIEEVESGYNALDRYRGLDYHTCKYPPKTVLQVEVNNTKLEINESRDYLTVLERQLKEKYSK